MEKSELLTEIYAKDIFLTQYTFNSVKVKIGKLEYELCDCLIELGDFYIIIQVKEKSANGESNDYQWFKNKVIKKAKQQIKSTIELISNTSAKFFHNEQEIIIQKNKKILPVILFYGTALDYYQKLYYSKALSGYINIFDEREFKTMLETVKVPFDIIHYLVSREFLLPKDGTNRFIFDDVSDNVTIITRNESEEDYAMHYLARNYFDKNISFEYIDLFNKALKNLNEKLCNARNPLLELLLTLNTQEINQIVGHCLSIIEDIKNTELLSPAGMICKDKGILFMKHPYGMDDEQFLNFTTKMGLYFSYKNKLLETHAIIFKAEANDNFSITPALGHYSYTGYNEDLELLVSEIEGRNS